MHFNENKNTTLEKAHKTQNGHFYEREKNRKKARQAMVEQNLRNDKKVIKSRFNLRYQPHGLERCDTSLSLSFFIGPESYHWECLSVTH